MHMDDDCPACAIEDRAPVSMVDARLARLATENRRLRQALREARLAALEEAARACADAEVVGESGGLWHIGLTDALTRDACLDALRRLLYAERRALHAEQADPPAEVVRLGA